MTRLTLAALALALAVPAAAQTRIGIIDRARFVEETEEGKASTTILKKDFEEKQKQLDARKSELERAQGEFEKQSVVLSDEAKREKAVDLNRRGMELGQVYQQMQGELSKRESELFRPLIERMSGLIKEIAEAEGIQLVFDRGQVVYAAGSLDLTNELIRKYNARYPVKPKAGGAAAKPAPGPKSPPGQTPTAPTGTSVPSDAGKPAPAGPAKPPGEKK